MVVLLVGVPLLVKILLDVDGLPVHLAGCEAGAALPGDDGPILWWGEGTDVVPVQRSGEGQEEIIGCGRRIADDGLTIGTVRSVAALLAAARVWACAHTACGHKRRPGPVVLCILVAVVVNSIDTRERARSEAEQEIAEKHEAKI